MRFPALPMLGLALVMALTGCSSIRNVFSKPPPPYVPPVGSVSNPPYQIGPGDTLSVADVVRVLADYDIHE